MELVVYIKEGCHLCEQMMDELNSFGLPNAVKVRPVVIDGNESLMQKYGSSVPVLTYLDQEVCHYFLDPDALTRALSTG